jgi:hypothetical protein
MATKKQSTKSADSGWLLEIGVIGIDKTLKLIRLSRVGPLELESFYRRRSAEDDELTTEEKCSLPWKNIKDPRTDETVKDRHYKIYYPTTVLTHFALKKDSKIKKQKGGARKPLDKWRINRKTYTIITKGNVGYQWKLFNRIKAESLILWDVIQVLRGERKSMPKSYANKITQRFYDQKNQAKVRQIIQESLAISMEHKLRTEKELNEYKIKLKKMENERIDVITHMAFLSQKLKKWGKQSQK